MRQYPVLILLGDSHPLATRGFFFALLFPHFSVFHFPGRYVMGMVHRFVPLVWVLVQLRHVNSPPTSHQGVVGRSYH